MPDRPNLVLILSDQLSWGALGAYGNACARTPHLDALAGRGVRFERAYTTCPLCQPARAALWTGRFPHQTGVLSNAEPPPVPWSLPGLGELLTQAGYRAVHVGKTHDAGTLRGFEVAPSEEERDVPAEGPWLVDYDTRRDAAALARAEDMLHTHGAGPFCLVADFRNPHNICKWVGAHKGPHANEPVPGPLPPLPDNFETADLAARPLPVQYICCTHIRQSQTAGWTPENFRHYVAAYNHYTERMDRCAGRVLDALAERSDADRTLVVFVGDHGDGMAAHGMVTKQVSLYEETTRVPLIFAGPGVSGRGRACAQPLVSHLDLLPTLCEAAGIDPPPGLWGRSLAPWLAGRQQGTPHPYVAAEWHTEWGHTASPGRMVRTDRYKYIRYREADGEELYDLRADPGETRTLAADPAHAEALEAHRRLLHDHLAKTADPFDHLGWKADARWRSHPVGYRYHEGPAAPEAAEKAQST